MTRLDEIRLNLKAWRSSGSDAFLCPQSDIEYLLEIADNCTCHRDAPEVTLTTASGFVDISVNTGGSKDG